MKVLVTGSSGWLGRFLVPALKAQGHDVIGIDPVPAPTTDVLGSVSDTTLIEALFAKHGFEGVVHAGALHKPDIVRYTKQRFVDVNVMGTLNLLEAAVAYDSRSFVFTSTTSLMITQAIRDEVSAKAIWLDEKAGPLEPRNIYGVTKRSAEDLCRLTHAESRLPIIILRTARFFPEDDDTHRVLTGENMKANELLFRRLTVEDCVDAHIAALNQSPTIGFGIYIVSAPPPFQRQDCAELKEHAPAVIARYFPDAAGLYAAKGWSLPTSIGRIYDPSAIERDLKFRCKDDFGAVLAALRGQEKMPFAHNASYVSPNEVNLRATESKVF
ncbi:NAD-dependent epimerase/dehydratase family protein [Novosphingobium sp. JCM 18896]|uniref:NAD-dependent epimerase/dehydratase family protein n=1 Tax=Novosphingobium sp. JCM 18896 TaxID=2989731 RepID=UPI002223E53E|nr:NAD(P)-dependent oxidoreductase [Novosphingobium sp. JCM 18896]MCW1431614.1 NAD(P)-dependent oxidoreductase [Novosphingobium sp. JCM 18896]